MRRYGHRSQSEDPKWYDEYAVPRYCEPDPDKSANIYADEVAFVKIACQNCGQRFVVAFSTSMATRLIDKQPLLSEVLASGGILHYGDPPNAGCCMAGPTMNSEPIRVLQFWKKVDHEWQQDSALEVIFDDL